MRFDSFEIFLADRLGLITWLMRTATPTLRAPRESPVQGECWRTRRPLEMRGRRYEAGRLIVVGETRIAIETGNRDG